MTEPSWAKRLWARINSWPWRQIRIITSLIVIALALELAYLGYSTAQDTSHGVASADRKRADSQCLSGKQFREEVLGPEVALWHRIDSLFIDPNTTRPDLIAAHKAIERYREQADLYLSTNPNCKNLPPKS